MLNKLRLLYHTVKYLKPIQIKYQVLYRLRKVGSLKSYQTEIDTHSVERLSFLISPPVYPSYWGNNKFVFLNREKDFEREINWRFQEYGALWNYNLQYLNVLLENNIELEEKLRLINSIYGSGIILEPYPVSLRSINVMRLISNENIQDTKLLKNLYAELNFLSDRLEYHLLGNHLLENGFALMMGGAFFQNTEWIKTAQNLLEEQLEEQILADGAHFELSPMYHQIIFFRVLELIDWYSDWKEKQLDVEDFLRKKAAKMWGWLRNMTFQNGDIPPFNDSALGIAYSTPWLSNYAEALKIKKVELPLDDSGYRKKDTANYECRIDFAQMGARYQPGHAHADALSFILYRDQKPVLVEQGTSTYDIGKKRSEERSTQAHNTVVVDSQNQSQVWSGFRVGNRAVTRILEDKNNYLKAEHDGYKKLGTLHRRSFLFEEEKIVITDELTNRALGVAYFHLAPSYTPKKIAGGLYEIGDAARFKFTNFAEIRMESYALADGYYQYRRGKRLMVFFTGSLVTEITVL